MKDQEYTCQENWLEWQEFSKRQDKKKRDCLFIQNTANVSHRLFLNCRANSTRRRLLGLKKWSDVTQGSPKEKVWLEKQLDCAHPLVLNNGAPISWASSIMSVYDEATPYVAIWRYLNLATWNETCRSNRGSAIQWGPGTGGQIPAFSSQNLWKL